MSARSTAKGAQRHLITSNLAVIEDLTGLAAGLVNTEDPAFRRPPWQPGYWLSFDYRLTGSAYNQHLGWSWVLSTVRVPADRREPITARTREIPADMAEAILRLAAIS